MAEVAKVRVQRLGSTDYLIEAKQIMASGNALTVVKSAESLAAVVSTG